MTGIQQTLGFQVDGNGPALAAASGSPSGRDRRAYIEECAFRWQGECLRDARRNWNLFKEHHNEIVEILKPYLRDPCCEDLAGKMHNPSGTLTEWLWLNSERDPWIFDFCEHWQRCHLRRGLIAYCKQVISEIKANAQNEPRPQD
jgi:hypothetical protein